MAINLHPSGRFGTALTDALEKNNMSLNELGEKTESTYEHTRKLVRGMAYPSKHLLKAICKVLDLKVSEMEDLINADKIQHKYGNSANRLFKRNPELEEVERNWDYLSEDQKSTINTMISTFRKQNSAAKRA